MTDDKIAAVFAAAAKLRSIRANADAYSEAEYAAAIAEAEANLDADLARAAEEGKR